MQHINLDLSIRGVIPVLCAKQGDVGRKFTATLTENGAAYVVPDGAQFSVWYSGTGGEGNYSRIGEASAFAVDGNTVTVELITQMLSNPGSVKLCLILNAADGSQVGFWNIECRVEHVPGSDSKEAEQYYTAFSEYASQAIASAEAAAQSEAAASQSANSAKEAADVAAEAARKELESKLNLSGGTMTGSIDMGGNTISNVGDPVEDGDAANKGYVDGNFAPAIESAEHPGCYYRITDGVVEWINPPIAVGVEYRTTERWQGKPVYAMLAYLGTTTESMTGTISLDAKGQLVRAVPQLGTSLCADFPLDAEINVANKFYFLAERFDAGVTYYVICGTNRVGYDLHVQIWYTKD